MTILYGKFYLKWGFFGKKEKSQVVGLSEHLSFIGFNIKSANYKTNHNLKYTNLCYSNTA